LSLILWPSGLRHRLALRLHARTSQRSGCRIHTRCRIYLLPLQFLHLLTRVAISMSCLSGEVSHLSLARLLGGDVRWLRCLPRSRRTLIRDLQVLSSRLSSEGLDA